MPQTQPRSVPVWDLLVRTFHWGLVAAFTAAWLTGDELDEVHEILGYTILALVLFRIAWGFVGTRHARFSSFLVSPAKLAAHVRNLVAGRREYHLGHNPAGGYMVMLILATLLALCVSGIVVEQGESGEHAAAPAIVATAHAHEGEEYEREGYGEEEYGERGEAHEFWEETHEFLANFMLLLIALHLLGVAVMSVKQRENLARAMVTGRKTPPPETTGTR